MFGLISGAVICIAVSFFGLIIKHKYKVNSDFMNAYADFIGYAKSEIANNKTPLYSIIDSYCSRKQNVFSTTLRMISANLKKDVVDTESYPKECYLVDKSAIKGLINDIVAIGKYDSVTEVNKLNTLEQRVTAEAHKAEEKFKKDGVMAFKLSVLVGIAIMIILC